MLQGLILFLNFAGIITHSIYINNKHMRKLALALMMAIVALTACNNNEKQLAAQQATIDSLAQAQNLSAEEIQDYVTLINTISTSIDSLNVAEDELKSVTREGTPATQRELLKQKVAALASAVNNQRAMIERLKGNLSASGSKNAQLQNLITFMQKQLDEKDAMIAQLQADIADKNKNIEELTATATMLTNKNTELSTTVVAQNEAIENQTNKMNEAFVKVGTKKELKDLGLVEGGTLFKKKKLNAENIDKNLFQKVDMRSYKSITLQSTSPKILTQMPADSYELTTNGSTTVLTITNAQRFWGVSNFLIIQL